MTGNYRSSRRFITSIAVPSLILASFASPRATSPTRPGTGPDSAVTCELQITTPKAGSKVGKDGWVRGTAKIPDGTHLWILAHVKDLAEEWWPQGEHAAKIERDSTWVIKTGYGREADIKETFEVAAVVVDDAAHAKLTEWFKTAKKLDYPYMEFPDIADGCVPVKVLVTKSSH